MGKLTEGCVYIEVSHNQSGGKSLLICNDRGGTRIQGDKVGGCDTIASFEVDAETLISEIRKESGVTGWIKCNDDTMPNKGQRVIVTITFDSDTVPPIVKDAEYTGSTFRIGSNCVNTDGVPRVTGWMPLPEPMV